MLSVKYSEAAVEVLDILDHMDRADYDKVPEKFINMLEENASKEYKCDLDYSKSLIEMGLREETRALLGVIYRNYWCPKEKREEFDRKLAENERQFQAELREKYNPDNIFGTNTNSVENTSESKKTINSDVHASSSVAEINSDIKQEVSSNTEIAIIKEESIFKRFINKILSLFLK